MNRLVRGSARLVLISCESNRVAAHTRPTLWNYRPQRLASSDTDFKPSEELAKERYDLRANEDIEKKRARLLYQSRKRGMLENGVILASFANKYLAKFDAEHLDQYDRLINLPTNDWDIYYWATKTKPTPPEFETPVLSMLREHLTSKVSSEKEGRPRDAVLGKTRLDDIVMPAAKKLYELDIDPSEVDLTNFKQELFDHRIKHYRYNSIQLMTHWRKRFFERRLRRTISAPTSIKTLSRTDARVFTQKAQDKKIASEIVEPKNLIETQYERAMKHHNFMQHLLSSNLTNNALDYDDEAQAWADMMWHRNYGINDDKIAPSKSYNCAKCRARLHCCDSGLRGYVPKEIFISIGAHKSLTPDNLMCQTCKFSTTYGVNMSHEMSPQNYEDFLRQLVRKKSALIVLLVDLTDFPGSIWEGLVDLVGEDKLFLVVGNKLDLLPYDGPKLIERVNYAFRKNLSRLRPGNRNLRITDSMVISARTGYGVEGLVTRILDQIDQNHRDVYLIGSNNSGKSTLFSALLQSDLSAKRTGDILSRLTKYELPGTKTSMLKFPIDLAEGWEVEMKKRRSVRTERNSAERIYALGVTSDRRQELMPQMSALINRLDYLTSADSSELAEVHSADQDVTTITMRPRFTEDHPLATVEDGEPLSASEDIFTENVFFHHTPSASTPEQLHNLLTLDERLEVFPNETIIPRKYTLRPHQSIFIAGLARLDLLTSTSTVIFTVFASRYLPVHVIQTRQADKFYNQFLGSPYLGVPFGNEARLAAWPDLLSSEEDFHIRSKVSAMGSADVVLSSVGWTLISLGIDQECTVRAFTPEGRGIFLRDPPLLAKASLHSTGAKIRDTPVFKNPNYQITSSRI